MPFVGSLFFVSPHRLSERRTVVIWLKESFVVDCASSEEAHLDFVLELANEISDFNLEWGIRGLGEWGICSSYVIDRTKSTVPYGWLSDKSPIKSRNCFLFARIQSRLWMTIWLTGGYIASGPSSNWPGDFHLHVLEAWTSIMKSNNPPVKASRRGSKTRGGIGPGNAWTHCLHRTPCQTRFSANTIPDPSQSPMGLENNHPGSVWTCDP